MMAFRLASAKSPLRGLLNALPKLSFGKYRLVRNSSIFVEPPVPWLDNPSIVFSSTALKHHWGAIPVVIITAIGFAIEFLVILRLAATRDDLWYTKGAAACDFIETRKGYKVPIRKFMVINQKYENPPGLLAAIQGDVDGPVYCPPGDKCEKKGISGKVLAAHAVIGIGAMCAMVAL
ncbi:uncharacterized protein LOC6574627 isoform X1 [Drosophila mojavensis]|uniref:Uncharacterized protein, isoform A n=1 Tax=Drosophila mojavensis TaxID=7230 RepID=B4K4W9_DROMO|nr:uncharacterized protein LOC6574627 isoform X1 [Drosophila mojavensis]EDW16122.2 uncharacterized protein Dmoj_GI10358, isoform A [Drosophila mojavensis]